MKRESAGKYHGGREDVWQQLLVDYPFLREAKTQSPEEHFRPGEVVTSRINSGDLSGISDTLKPIIELGCQNSGVRFVEVNAWDSCPLHIVMEKPLVVPIETCLEFNQSVQYFRYHRDPHFSLPDLDCFKCVSTGEIVAFPLEDDVWSISNHHDSGSEVHKYWMAVLVVVISLMVGLISATIILLRLEK